MQGYIIGILGIVIISVLVEIILPSGQTAKYIKSLLSVFVVFVLVNPIINFINDSYGWKSWNNREENKVKTNK